MSRQRKPNQSREQPHRLSSVGIPCDTVDVDEHDTVICGYALRRTDPNRCVFRFRSQNEDGEPALALSGDVWFERLAAAATVVLTVDCLICLRLGR